MPDTLNVLRQQMIARVVVTAFFEAQLAGDAHRRQRAATYLQEVMAREIPEASYRRAAGAR